MGAGEVGVLDRPKKIMCGSVRVGRKDPKSK